MQGSRAIRIEETERKPNRYAARVLAGVVAVMAFACAMNEMGVFEMDRGLMRICFAASIAQFVFIQSLVRRPSTLSHHVTKYLIVGTVLLLVLTVTVLLNINAVLGFVLPLLLATQYRSHRLSLIAVVGSCLCCLVAPVLSWLLGTWSLNFLIGYVETFCRVTVSVAPGSGFDALRSIGRITLYWSLPQTLTLAAFGLILYAVTGSGIDSVENQVRVQELSESLSRQLESLQETQEKVLYAMSDIIESRDVETGGHVRRTSEIVRLLTLAMRDDPDSGVTDAFCNNVIKCAPMHDLGKIAVPDTILRKPGRLTDEEYEIVKGHPAKSAEIIRRALTGIEDEWLIATGINIAKYHHERMDGKGYPERLIGKQIPLEARIMSIADVYDALVSERCYKAPMTFDQAFEIIEQSMGTQFDADLNPYFLSCRRQIERFYANGMPSHRAIAHEKSAEFS